VCAVVATVGTRSWPGGWHTVTTSGARAAAARELLVVVGLALAGIILAAVATFGTFPLMPVYAPVVDVTSPGGPLP
jgi:hypothetical protein